MGRIRGLDGVSADQVTTCNLRVIRAVLSLALVAGLALGLAADAAACVCENAPIGERLDRADVAFVGRVVAEKAGELEGQPQRLLTVDVDQRVKGKVEDTVVVRTFSQTDCALEVRRNEPVGLLLTRDTNGDLVGSACSIVDPGVLVAAGGEPRGGVIKVVIGLGILAVVLLWAFRRRRRGTRPDLPGAPEP